MPNGRISEAQLVTMLMYTVLGTAYFFLPSVAAGFAGRDVWLTPFPATAAGLVVAWAAGSLGACFPGAGFFDWMEILLGAWGGKILQFVYILLFLDVTSTIAAEFSYFMNIAFLPQTPPLLLTGLLLLLAGAAVYGGPEIMARAATVFLPVTLVIFFGLWVMGAGLYDPANLRPFLEKGITPVLLGSLTPASWRGEVLLGAFFFPLLDRPERGGRVLVRTVLWLGVLLFWDALALDLAFGQETARFSLPVFSLSREISLLQFFEHMESIVLISWVAGVFIKTAVWYYAMVAGTAQLLNLKGYRPLVLPAGLLMLALSGYNWPDVTVLAHFVATVVPFYTGGTFEYAIPLLLAALGLVRQRKTGRARRKAWGVQAD